MHDLSELQPILNRIYGRTKGGAAYQALLPVLKTFRQPKANSSPTFSENDVILITYGDSIQEKHGRPLKSLGQFANLYLKDVFSTIHILPFFPFSSDDGFSVMDFTRVDPLLGRWDDIKNMGKGFSLMFDYVLNHISAKSEWFEHYLNGNSGYKDLAIEVEPGTDLSQVARPRSLPLLTEFTKASGRRVLLWTTFSDDQIDLNYKSPEILAKMISVLLHYVSYGATILRLDAIAYLWKEIGTSCIHLPQTHDMVKLFRKILDIIAPWVMVLTETNVPHEENISYFGNGSDEAQMVYNFTLPPLLLYSFMKQDVSVFNKWAKGLEIKSATNTFFNFTASHDGIGVRPLEGILPKSEIDMICRAVEKKGGNISFKNNSDGSASPYELNITYLDALSIDSDKGNEHHIKRFLASQAISYVLPGIPATYIHSLTGSRNWTDGVKKTGRFRTINREKLDMEQLLLELNDNRTFRSQIFHSYLNFIRIRRQQPAFHPKAGFEILDLDKRVFGIRRFCRDQTLYCLTNISEDTVPVRLSELPSGFDYTDVISGKRVHHTPLNLAPYQFVWLCRSSR